METAWGLANNEQGFLWVDRPAQLITRSGLDRGPLDLELLPIIIQHLPNESNLTEYLDQANSRSKMALEHLSSFRCDIYLPLIFILAFLTFIDNGR
ncbi:hypothetical protein DCAR_0206664 [Daucus carota subsp. sativus]|uniref:Uncharacterized protein n=1 Tax=Daucus carota subsp. sativus TaxID=79200 RepID=A0A161Y6Q2_DAUCS|nr:hypothetical protein DCAR_0206664 [Daucus carota subsp. sativus]